MIRSFTAAICILFVIYDVQSENAANCSILSHSIYDTSTRINDEQRALAFRNSYCQKQFKDQQSARGFILNAGIPAGDIPVFLGLNSTQSDLQTV
jgi:hypothetical protein